MAMVPSESPSVMARRVRTAHEKTHGTTARLVARAPGRVNLIGEHTDYNGGLCLPVALPHATYAAASARPDDHVTLVSAQAAERWSGHLDELGPGRLSGWVAYVGGVLWALREDGIDVPGVDLTLDSTVPLGAGLSSSAAVECAVAVAVCGLLGRDLDDGLRRRLVAACVRAESEVAGAPTGGMDQQVSLLAREGSALLLDFRDDTARPVPLPLAEAGLALLVTDTRVSHELTDGGYGARRRDCEAAARALGVDTLRDATAADLERIDEPRLRRRARHVVTEIVRVSATVDAVAAGDWAAVGALFADSHASMRDDFEISCPELDLAVGTAVEAGAVAARMTGGGFGGSTVALVPRERVDAVVRAVDAAYAAAGYAAPDHLAVTPGGAADLVGPDG